MSKKSDLLPLLSQNDFGNTPENDFDIIALDGGALVHLLSTANITTFDQYADDVVIPHILKQLERCTHVDIVWDTYVFDSIYKGKEKKIGAFVQFVPIISLSHLTTTHSSLQKHAIHTKKSAVYCDNNSTLNLVHTSIGKHTGVSGELHHN